MGCASADRDFLFTGKEIRKTQGYVCVKRYRQRTTVVMYGLFLSPELG